MLATVAILKVFKPYRMSEWVQTWWEALGWHGDLELLNLFQYPPWAPWWPSWKSWNDISPKMVSQTKLKVGGRHWGDSELPNWFHSDIQDGGHLEILQTNLPNFNADWTQHWWEALELHRDSEFLKLFCSDIYEGESIKNQRYLFLDEIDLFFFYVIAL